MKAICIKRIYDAPSEEDGYRILVDRIWPRGITKEYARLDEWNKTLAPSTELRKWFSHKAERFNEFARRYRNELMSHKEELKRIRQIARNKPVTLLYSAKNTEANQAVVLCKVLKQLKI
ncbi:MAG: hypothetical protein KatS3mg031_0170 [Chitinophagales bacterium]|nr:MAG: hypothetical protein KatS3mg031_0170 [Chitinophagales bacterium]